MANVTLRLVKGSPLTNQEVDNNFSNLNIFKTEIGGDLGGNVFYPTVIGLQGRSVSNVSPANLQVLSWSESANAWVPGNAVGASSYSDLQTKPAVNVTITGDVTGGANVLLVNTNTNNLAINVSYDYDNLDSRFLKLHNPSTQYVTSYVEFQGNVIFAGNVTTIAANNLIIEDNFIYLASNNFVSNDDFGFAGNYNDGIYAHAGFFRDASDNGTWKIFEGYLPEPSEALNIDTDNASFRLANLAINALTANTIQGIVSTAVVTNLNADLLDGQQGVYYTNYANQTNKPAANIILTGDVTGSANAILTANTNIISIVTALAVTGSSSWLVKTANYTAASGDKIIANSSASSFVITLPSSPNVGDNIVIADGNNWSVTSINVSRNSSTIENIAEDFTLDVPGVVVDFIYDGSTWKTYVTSGDSGNVVYADKFYDLNNPNYYLDPSEGSVSLVAKGNLSTEGNVVASYFVGDGSKLTGLSAGGATLTSPANNFIVIAGACSITSTGCNNIFIGANAGACTTFGKHNFFAGQCAGYCNTTGNYNTFLGSGAGRNVTLGTNNIIIGCAAGSSNTSNTIILATGTVERIKTEGDLGNTSITGNVTANAFIGNGNLLTQVNADMVDGIHIAVVTSLPGSPDPNTLYIVTG